MSIVLVILYEPTSNQEKKRRARLHHYHSSRLITVPLPQCIRAGLCRLQSIRQVTPCNRYSKVHPATPCNILHSPFGHGLQTGGAHQFPQRGTGMHDGQKRQRLHVTQHQRFPLRHGQSFLKLRENLMQRRRRHAATGQVTPFRVVTVH